MKTKVKGPQTFPTGKFPNVNEGLTVRPFTPARPPGKGPQTFPLGETFGTPGPTDNQKGHNPGPVKSKGPQTMKDSRFGDTKNQNQDPSRPYNPK